MKEQLKKYEDYLNKEGLRKGTVKSHSNSLRRFFKWLEKEDIPKKEVNYTDLLGYIKHCKNKGNVPHTIRLNLQAVKHYYRMLQAAGKITSNPSETLKIKGIIRRQPHDLLEWEQLEELYTNYPTASLSGKRNKVLFGMMIYQALGSGEIAKLEVKDVELETGRIYVKMSAKSNDRYLKLQSHQVMEVQKYIHQIRPMILQEKQMESDKLFITIGKGTKLSNCIKGMLSRLKKQNPKLRNALQIRGSVLTEWLKKHKIREVQYMAGHRYISSTERYRTDHLEGLQEQVDELHPLN